jgi:hypothetical protein
MVNYDLPWNPNRIEQRFGRIHRIGQTEVCHLWNLCASNTREGEVYRRLLEKLEEARKALGGKVYDVLGELFEGQALRDLLVEAIRYGDIPETRAELFRKVDGVVDVAAIEKLVAERKLTSEGMDPNSELRVRDPRADGARAGASSPAALRQRVLPRGVHPPRRAHCRARARALRDHPSSRRPKASRSVDRSRRSRARRSGRCHSRTLPVIARAGQPSSHRGTSQRHKAVLA